MTPRILKSAISNRLSHTYTWQKRLCFAWCTDIDDRNTRIIESWHVKIRSFVHVSSIQCLLCPMEFINEVSSNPFISLMWINESNFLIRGGGDHLLCDALWLFWFFDVDIHFPCFWRPAVKFSDSVILTSHDFYCHLSSFLELMHTYHVRINSLLL